MKKKIKFCKQGCVAIVVMMVLFCMSCSQLCDTKNQSSIPTQEKQDLVTSSIASSEPVIKEDETKIIRLNIIYNEYNGLSSVTPGYPFVYEYINDQTVDKIELTVDNGEFCLWNQDTGKVTNMGKAMECKVGTNFYWSELETNAPVANSATIKMKAYKDKKLFEIQEITISQLDYKFHATANEIQLAM